jgi:hypothetical protein
MLLYVEQYQVGDLKQHATSGTTLMINARHLGGFDLINLPKWLSMNTALQ